MPMSRISTARRNIFIAASVVLFHVAALWALQTGLLRRAVEIIVPAEILSELIEPAPVAPHKTPPSPPPRQALPEPAPPIDQSPQANAPVVVETAPQPPAAPSAVAAPADARPAPAPVHVDLPSSDAQYLNNPKPRYPPMSNRLGETGTVVVRVLIGADGTAQKAEIQRSSGFARLDKAALDAVLGWRYVPGKRGGVPEAMWYTVPIKWGLEDQ
jgi:periplasmic protein TonB